MIERILSAFAAIATIGVFLLELVREFRSTRKEGSSKKEEKR